MDIPLRLALTLRGTSQSGITESLPCTAQMEPLYTPAGVYLGDHPTMPLDWERVSRVVGMMTRGLYYKLRREPFPQGYSINVVRVYPLEVQAAWDAISAAHFNGPYHLGEDIFVCKMQVVAEDTGMTRWLLSFYQNYVLLVTTRPEVPNPDLRPPW